MVSNEDLLREMRRQRRQTIAFEVGAAFGGAVAARREAKREVRDEERALAYEQAAAERAEERAEADRQARQHADWKATSLGDDHTQAVRLAKQTLDRINHFDVRWRRAWAEAVKADGLTSVRRPHIAGAAAPSARATIPLILLATVLFVGAVVEVRSNLVVAAAMGVVAIVSVLVATRSTTKDDMALSADRSQRYGFDPITTDPVMAMPWSHNSAAALARVHLLRFLAIPYTEITQAEVTSVRQFLDAQVRDRLDETCPALLHQTLEKFAATT